jgi:hypothetical protein
MKKILLLLACAFTITANAQDDKTVTLVVSGQGKTQDEAKQNALRNAIEQAFGTFISSKTEILNDNLVKDEIVSVSNGNIQKFEVISEVQIPNIGYATSLKATVSVTKLTSFVESKGITADFKGNLFAFNIKQQIFNEQNEIKAISDLYNIMHSISLKTYDYSLKINDPIANGNDNQNWKINLIVSVTTNDNLNTISSYLFKTLKGISLIRAEQLNYRNLGKVLYPLSLSISETQYDHLIFRTAKAQDLLEAIFQDISKGALNFKINNGVSEVKLSSNELERYSKIIKEKYLLANSSDNLYTFGLPQEGTIKTGNSAWMSSIEKLYSKNREINNSFPFVSKLKNKMFGETSDEKYWKYSTYVPFSILMADPGVIVALGNISSGKEIINISINDFKTIQELDKITKYEISAINEQ